MATRKKQTVIEEVNTTPDESPGVIAYRVGQLERAQSNGFATLNDKLDGILNGFVTKEEMVNAKENSVSEHKQIYAKIADVEKDVLDLNRKRWVQNTLSAVLGGVLTLLIGYFITHISV